MKTTIARQLTEEEQRLLEAQRRVALISIHRRYAELDRITGKTAAERFEEARRSLRAE